MPQPEDPAEREGPDTRRNSAPKASGAAGSTEKGGRTRAAAAPAAKTSGKTGTPRPRPETAAVMRRGGP